MSSDNIFASQMWTWPDPVLKRDTSGRVLFLNMAFLRLYGGTAEAWHGNVVSGWPAPNPAQGVNRFETRIPRAPQPGYMASETVYDWIEHGLADGHVMAIARDVTGLLPAAAPAPVPITPPVVTPADVAPPANAHSEITNNQQGQANAAQANAAPPPQHNVEQATPAAPVTEPLVAQAPALTTSSPATQSAKTQSPSEQPERDFERRPLPIENQDSVLGNNWRDAVIAKAVGAEIKDATSSAETKPDTSTSGSLQNIHGTGKSDDEPPRVLLAEDNAINALLTRTLLEAEGCVVDVVEDGVLAVQAIKNAPYDMIFMDMRMPNMDGLEATRKIRALDHESKGLPIVALTANAFDDDRNACFDSGMNDFMTKPVSAEELSLMVKTWTKKAEENNEQRLTA